MDYDYLLKDKEIEKELNFFYETKARVIFFLNDIYLLGKEIEEVKFIRKQEKKKLSFKDYILNRTEKLIESNTKFQLIKGKIESLERIYKSELISFNKKQEKIIDKMMEKEVIEKSDQDFIDKLMFDVNKDINEMKYKVLELYRSINKYFDLGRYC